MRGVLGLIQDIQRKAKEQVMDQARQDHADFHLFQKPNGIFWFSIWHHETGHYRKARSSGTRNKAKAIAHAFAYIDQQQLNNLFPTDPVFVDFLLLNWDWTLSPYVWHKLRQRQGGLTRAYVQQNYSFCSKYAKPFFKRLKLSEVSSLELNNFLLYLRDTTSLAPKSINAIYNAVAIPLHEAFRLRRVYIDPTQAIRI